MNRTHLAIIASIPLLMTGCYTHLMSPQEFIRVQRQTSNNSSARPVGYSASSLNYGQACLTCHSANELDDRYSDLTAAGIMTVHDGIRLNPSDWTVPVNVAGIPDGPIYLPAPNPYPQPYWPRPADPDLPWWNPPVVTTGSGATTAPGSPSTGRPRPNGPSRDDTPNNDRATPIPTYVPTGPTTPAPVSTGGSAVTVQPSPASTPAPSTPPANTGTRTRDNAGSASGSHERTSGSSRGNDDNDRPR